MKHWLKRFSLERVIINYISQEVWDMGATRASKTDMRKLQATGENGSSYMITLPKELVEELKWRKGRKLTVTREGKKLVVQDWK